MARRTFPENLLQRMESQENGCIYFTGAITNRGYGTIWVDGRNDLAHRAAYEYFVGPIPSGMTVDHVCHNEDPSCDGGNGCLHRRCVNGDHLEAKTRGENVLAGTGASAVNARKTHCIQGHEFTPENTYMYKGRRQCVACTQARSRKHYRTRKRRRQEAFSSKMVSSSRSSGS